MEHNANHPGSSDSYVPQVWAPVATSQPRQTTEQLPQHEVQISALGQRQTLTFDGPTVRSLIAERGRECDRRRQCRIPPGSNVLSREHMIERLTFGLDEAPECGCWLWKRACFRFGHGQINVLGRKLYAHRLAYTLAHGEISPGMWVLHSCDVPGCIRPDHLHLGTAVENNRETVERGRRGNTRGEANGAAILSEPIVRELRFLLKSGRRVTELARERGISHAQMSRIKSGKVWGHVPV